MPMSTPAGDLPELGEPNLKPASAGGAGGGMGGGAGGGSNTASQISSWVTANFKSVTIGGTTFYDLTQPLSGS